MIKITFPLNAPNIPIHGTKIKKNANAAFT